MTSATSAAVTATGIPHHHARPRRQNRRPTARGASTLMYAAQQGDVDRVRNIIRDQPESLESRDRTGKTSLHYCCTSDSIRAAQAADLLVMAAPDLVENRDEDGFTPLHLAVIAGNMSLVTFLLANKADVNSVDNEKHTVVHWATVCGETAALRAVLAAGAPVSTPDVHGGYPLHYAAQMCGGDKDSNLGIQVLQTLLAHNDVVVSVEDGDGRQPLLWAASAGSTKAVLALIRAGAKVESSDKDGLTALHCAASRGHTDCIDSLLTLCGASPDVIDSNGCTALHYAVTLGHADATALLLAHGADPNRQDRKGRTPAHCGCAKGQFETVKMIAAHDANLWLRNARGDLPLHEAAASGRRDLVRWLLDMRPSQVNARNNDGRCPLHLAALNDNADMCKILLDAGAQVNPILRTSKNTFMTPLDCALQRGFRSTAKYLQLHGGVPATRLGDVRQKHANPQTKEANFWDESSSESEREKQGKRTQKKIIHKSDKRRGSLSESDAENHRFDQRSKQRVVEKTHKAKPTGNGDGSVDLSSRKTSPTKFETKQDKTVVKEQAKTTTLPITKAIEVAKTAPNEEVGDKQTRPKTANTKTKEKSPKAIGKETKTTKSVNVTPKHKPEAGGKKLRKTEKIKSDNHVESDPIKAKKLSDEQSVTSDDVEEHKNVIVEASIHEPPKDNQQETTTDVNANQKIDTSESKEVIKSVSVDTKQVTETEPKKDESLLVSGINETNRMTDFESKTDGANVNDTAVLPSESVGNLEVSNDAEIFENKKETGTTDTLAPQIDDNSEQTGSKEESGNTGEDSGEGIKLTEQQIVAETTNGIEKETIEPLTTETDTKEMSSQQEKSEHATNETDETHVMSEQSIVGAKKPQKPKRQKRQTDDQAYEIIYKTLENQESDDNLNDAIHKDKEEFKSREKLKTQKTISESKSSADEYSSDLESDSTSSTSATIKEHKSFRILNDKEADEMESKKIKPKKVARRLKSTPKKQRSRSEENRKVEKLKRSRIPTPLDKHLSKSDKYLNIPERKTKSSMESRVPSLPNINKDHPRPDSNLSAPLLPSAPSDNEKVSASELEDDEKSSAVRRKKVKRKAKREAESAGSDYESSNVIDSGFEPSPRSSRIPKWKNMSERGVNMTTVTQSTQSNVRRYHLERKIFQHLLELKRMQIRAGQHNEAVLVKRAIDSYHQSCASTVGAGRYVPDDFTFKSFEKFLYLSLRKLQRNGADYLKGLPETSSNPLLCTQSTHRCMHATHAYTGIPCAAYLPKMDHHTIPKIGFTSTQCKPGTGFLPTINTKKAVTLELCHGNDKQVISLPADRLDQNKRYYVTFTVKGSEHSPPNEDNTGHRHSKSD